MTIRDPRGLAMAASLGVASLMLVGKFWAFALTGSSAILADALESVVHLFATAFAAFGLWYASKPPDEQHPYGHGKIAYFAAAIEGVLIAIAAGVIIVTAGVALVTGPELQQLGLGLLITAALAAINGALGFALIGVGRRTNTLVLVSNGQHTLTDMWTSLGVLVGVALVWATGMTWLDPVVAMLVGVNILLTAYRLVRTAYDGLMERVDDAETERLIARLDAARDQGRIADWHHLRHRRINDHVWIEVHLLFEGPISLTEAHQRATRLEAGLRTLFPRDRVLVTTHLEPVSHEHPSAEHDDLTDALRPL